MVKLLEKVDVSHPQGSFKTSSHITGLETQWQVLSCLPLNVSPVPPQSSPLRRSPARGLTAFPSSICCTGLKSTCRVGSNWEISFPNKSNKTPEPFPRCWAVGRDRGKRLNTVPRFKATTFEEGAIKTAVSSAHVWNCVPQNELGRQRAGTGMLITFRFSSTVVGRNGYSKTGPKNTPF